MFNTIELTEFETLLKSKFSDSLLAVEQHYDVSVATIRTPEKQRAAHQSVATCLQAFADPHRDGQCRDATSHALSELPYHQTRAEAWPELIASERRVSELARVAWTFSRVLAISCSREASRFCNCAFAVMRLSSELDVEW